jgi:hypothetical protein
MYDTPIILRWLSRADLHTIPKRLMALVVVVVLRLV